MYGIESTRDCMQITVDVNDRILFKHYFVDVGELKLANFLQLVRLSRMPELELVSLLSPPSTSQLLINFV